MTSFEITALFLTLVGAGGWLNARTFRLPNSVAMMLVGMAGALAILGIDTLAPSAAADVVTAVRRVNFARAVLGYMLAFLLFAGAMQVDLAELRRRRLSVWTLATIGVAATTAIVGFGLWMVGRWFGVPLPLPWAFVFGALISPTDPVAVLTTVRGGDLSAALRAILQGEALFNDGVGIVVFTAMVALATGSSPNSAEALVAVVVKAAGGLALGVVSAMIVLRAMRAVDDFVVEISLTLALATGSYALAAALHLSGPIAAVGAGLLVGDSYSRAVMSETSQARLREFWSLIDEILNALLFFLLGLQLFIVRWEPRQAGLFVVATVLVAAARFAVVLPWGSYLHFRHEEHGASVLLAWGGLHGALSLALALSIPEGPERSLILNTTYVVATLSVAVQGLTFQPLTRWLHRREVLRP